MNSAANNDALHRLLYMAVAGHLFCLRLNDVERLLPLMRVQRVPEGPDYLLGVMNLRGEAVPVLDLGRRLNLTTTSHYALDTPVVLAAIGSLRAGLVVDEVRGVRAVPRSALRGDSLFRDGLPPVLSAVTSGDGTALLLDALRILDIDLSGLSQPLALNDELLSLCREIEPPRSLRSLPPEEAD